MLIHAKIRHPSFRQMPDLRMTSGLYPCNSSICTNASLCVMAMSMVRFFSISHRITDQICAWVIRSRIAVISSAMMSEASVITAVKKRTRRTMPPESWNR